MKEPYDYYTECQCGKDGECNKSVKHLMEISIPVDIMPKAKTGNIESECCSEPTVICEEGPAGCKGCRLIITQKICVKIPLSYDVEVRPGESMTDCCGFAE